MHGILINILMYGSVHSAELNPDYWVLQLSLLCRVTAHKELLSLPLPFHIQVIPTGPICRIIPKAQLYLMKQDIIFICGIHSAINQAATITIFKSRQDGLYH